MYLRYDRPVFFALGAMSPAFRLARYKEWIEKGWALDLNDAVRVNGQQRRLARLHANERLTENWPLRRHIIAFRRQAHLARIILTVARSCAFCSKESPTHITHLVPPSRGGADELGNMLPCCENCHEERHEHTPNSWAEGKSERVLRAVLDAI
ncbi:HNH endonuclease [Streptomyces sp. NPDC056707]|uniref:HNH endonuclease n=1 Tax=Streptomyces sp. NPDC056707 TaxID=3345919 RepID=UPI0036B881CF